ncbi:MAG TPA: hypothetical protein VGP07_18555 [Polyangia bacterium]|jgi:hypothetical protein
MPSRLRAPHFLLLALVGAGQGCSFLFAEGPPPEVRSGTILTCSQSYGWPLLDTAIAGYEGVRTGLALSRSSANYRGAQFSRGEDIGASLASLALFGVSAWYGYAKVNACDAAIDEAAKHEWGEQPLRLHSAPTPLPPPFPTAPPANPGDVATPGVEPAPDQAPPTP